MSKGLAGFLRFIFFILGVVLIALGVWPILIHFGVGFAVEAERWVDRGVWASVPDQPWWLWALIGIAVVSAVVGLWLIISSLRVKHFNKLKSEASTEDGDIINALSPITSGIAQHLEAQPGVEDASRSVAYDRGEPTVTFTVVADPDAAVPQLRALLEQTERDFREALPDVDVATRYKLHFSKLKPV